MPRSDSLRPVRPSVTWSAALRGRGFSPAATRGAAASAPTAAGRGAASAATGAADRRRKSGRDGCDMAVLPVQRTWVHRREAIIATAPGRPPPPDIARPRPKLTTLLIRPAVPALRGAVG